MQCFDTFRGFLRKLYAATMDGKSRAGTYNFYHNDWGQSKAGHRAQGAAPPATLLAPPMLMTALNCSNHLSGSLVKTSSLTPHPPTLHVQTSLQSWTWPKMTSFTSQTQPRTLIVNSLTQTQLLSPTSTEYRLPTHR